MEKVYLLLRNGHQSGPFTISDLMQQQLKASDMIWIEGYSRAWSYVSEMEFSLSTTEKISVSSTDPVSFSQGDEIERKAEELRKRALSYVGPQKGATGVFTPKTYKSTHLVNDEEPVRFIDHRKDKKSVVQEVIMTAVILAIFGAVLYGSRSYFNNNQQQNSVANQMVSTDQHAAISNIPVAVKPIEPVKDTSTTKVIMSGNDSIVTPIVKIKTASTRVIKKPVSVQPIPTEPIIVKEEDITIPAPSTPIEDVSKKEIEIKENLTPLPVEKKKTVGQALKGLFKKKKKSETTTEEQIPPDSRKENQ